MKNHEVLTIIWILVNFRKNVYTFWISHSFADLFAM